MYSYTDFGWALNSLWQTFRGGKSYMPHHISSCFIISPHDSPCFLAIKSSQDCSSVNLKLFSMMESWLHVMIYKLCKYIVRTDLHPCSLALIAPRIMLARTLRWRALRDCSIVLSADQIWPAKLKRPIDLDDAYSSKYQCLSIIVELRRPAML